MAGKNSEERPILIKRIKKGGGGHHGGAWKVAYADFTTAMMAFFMLLWLLNVTTKEQKAGLAEYFAPTAASLNQSSGAGGVLGGSAMSPDDAVSNGAVVMSMPKMSDTSQDESDGTATKFAKEEVEWQKALAERENRDFERIETALKQSIQEMPDLSALAENLVVDITEDGMRIQLIDKDQRSMFRTGTADLYDFAQKMLQAIAGKIQGVSNRVAITGHTDALPYSGANGDTNWELSAQRANAARRVLGRSGVSEDRFSMIRGMAATEPLLPDAPNRPENRRITILLMREAPVVPPSVQ